MEHVRPPRSRIPWAMVPAFALGVVLVAVVLKPAPVTPTPSSTPSSTSTPSTGTPSLAAIRSPSTIPTDAASPFPRLTAPPCLLPAAIPPPATPVASPEVTGTDVAVLFSARLNASSETGLWFVPKGSETPRLLAASVRGMVLPLALAPAGDTAAVWWLPERRNSDATPCISGIYVLSTTLGTSRLIASGDWARDGDGQGNGTIWSDPDTARTYRIPEASFSSDGAGLAIIDGDEIDIYGPDLAAPLHHHLGSCTNWAWAPARTTFIAGCENMTSAWVFSPEGSTFGTGEGDPPYSVALPWLRTDSFKSGWGQVAGHAIGLTRDDRIRVAGFYGFATGCEGDGPCTIPSPAYSVTTFDPSSNTTTSQSGRIDFLLNDVRVPVRFAADASWIYVNRADGGARTIEVGSGAVANAKRLGTYAGSSLDGSVLFGYRVDAGSVVISALNAAGRTVVVATIRRVDQSTPADPMIQADGLLVVDPSI